MIPSSEGRMTMAPTDSGDPDIEAMKAARDIPGLISALGYVGWSFKIPDSAQEALVQIGEPAVDPLIASLQEPNEIKWRAIRALGKIGDVRAIESLIAAFGEVGMQEDVAIALVQIGASSVEPLIVALANPDERVREYSAAALGTIRDVRAVDPLIVALTDPYHSVREVAVGALGHIGPPAYDKVLLVFQGGHTWARVNAARVLVAIDPIRAVPPLIAALGDADPPVLDAVRDMLVQIGPPAIDPLIGELKSSDANSRANAAIALERLGAVDAFEPLVDTLADPSPIVRARASLALGKIGDRRVTELLIAALEETDEVPRAAAALALGCLGDTRAVDPLIAVLTDEKSSVRIFAIRSLGKLGDARAVEPLIAALEDPNYLVRSAAAEALGKLGDERAVAPLVAVLRDTYGHVRYAAARALGGVADERAVDRLITELTNPDQQVRYLVVKLLSKIGDPRAIEPLKKMLDDPNNEVRGAVEDALSRIDDPG